LDRLIGIAFDYGLIRHLAIPALAQELGPFIVALQSLEQTDNDW
jgi:hypothetical protein